jgi:membrane protease YdiL (CAAX protease family)
LLVPLRLPALGSIRVGATVAVLSDPQILRTFKIDTNAILTILFGIEAGFFVYLLTCGALGEEPGLRGFALPRLQARHGPFKASAVIGLLWAGWHIPVLIGRDLVSVAAFLLIAFFLSFIFTWLFNNSIGSLIPVMIFHTTQNSEEVFEVLLPDLVGTDWELVSSLLLLIIGVVVTVGVWRQARSWPASFEELSGDNKQDPTS